MFFEHVKIYALFERPKWTQNLRRTKTDFKDRVNNYPLNIDRHNGQVQQAQQAWLAVPNSGRIHISSSEERRDWDPRKDLAALERESSTFAPWRPGAVREDGANDDRLLVRWGRDLLQWDRPSVFRAGQARGWNNSPEQLNISFHLGTSSAGSDGHAHQVYEVLAVFMDGLERSNGMDSKVYEDPWQFGQRIQSRVFNWPWWGFPWRGWAVHRKQYPGPGRHWLDKCALVVRRHAGRTHLGRKYSEHSSIPLQMVICIEDQNQGDGGARIVANDHP